MGHWYTITMYFPKPQIIDAIARDIVEALSTIQFRWYKIWDEPNFDLPEELIEFINSGKYEEFIEIPGVLADEKSEIIAQSNMNWQEKNAMINYDNELIDLITRSFNRNLTLFGNIKNGVGGHIDLAPSGHYRYSSSVPEQFFGYIKLNFSHGLLDHSEDYQKIDYFNKYQSIIDFIIAFGRRLNPIYGWIRLDEDFPVSKNSVSLMNAFPFSHTILDRNIQDLHRFNYWDKDLVREIGINRILSIPHYTVKELENDAIIIYWPPEYYRNNRLSMIDRIKMKLEAYEHLGFPGRKLKALIEKIS